ncbi:winged helix-turn-helix domain-containing protein [Rheinheimera sp. WS51]|uniref:winged helix-turn-helix domain-containing protein n=1 Tax=Rheinheimera sp. WS51 TaxID=3425886 RepID=UPI003D8AC12B
MRSLIIPLSVLLSPLAVAEGTLVHADDKQRVSLKLDYDIHLTNGSANVNLKQYVTVTRAGLKLKLSKTDFNLLMILANACPNAVSRQQLANKIWCAMQCDSDVIRSHIYTLRQALDKPFATPMLRTLHKQGYRLEATSSHFNDNYVANLPLAK